MGRSPLHPLAFFLCFRIDLFSHGFDANLFPMSANLALMTDVPGPQPNERGNDASA